MHSDIDRPDQVGLLGATSFVGACLLQKLKVANVSFVAYTRREVKSGSTQVEWRKLESELPLSHKINTETPIALWISLIPISVLPKYFNFLEAHNVRRIVSISSTSRFTKLDSSDPNEQVYGQHIIEAEQRVQEWAEKRGIEWIILRPTLIYGYGQDKNIVEIMRFVRRFGFFPVFGNATGLRQPIHVQDLAGACLALLQSSHSANRAYNISGAETLTYREMVIRIFEVLEKKPRIISIPLWMFRVAIFVVRRIGRYEKWSSAMAERMNSDMVFDHSDLKRDFEFKPRAFTLTVEDLPV